MTSIERTKVSFQLSTTIAFSPTKNCRYAVQQSESQSPKQQEKLSRVSEFPLDPSAHDLAKKLSVSSVKMHS